MGREPVWLGLTKPSGSVSNPQRGAGGGHGQLLPAALPEDMQRFALALDQAKGCRNLQFAQQAGLLRFKNKQRNPPPVIAIAAREQDMVAVDRQRAGAGDIIAPMADAAALDTDNREVPIVTGPKCIALQSQGVAVIDGRHSALL